MIKSLTKEYIQKSRIFLYPLLGIKRGFGPTPTESYVSWDGNFLINECKLICIYPSTEDEEFKKFERTRLFANKNFHVYYELDNGTSAYVFDLRDCEQDWSNFLMGKYSKFTRTTKDKVLDFFNSKPSGKEYVNSYFFPEKYYDNYADLLAVDPEVLKKVGELCSPPDLTKENLTASIKTVEMFSEI